MQSSSKKLNRTIERQIVKMLHQLLIDIKDEKEMKAVLSDLLTETERMAMAKRLAIALYLDKGRSYENIKNNLKVSSATIAVMAEQMGNRGVQMAIKRVKTEEWADRWSKKIAKFLKKIQLGRD